MIAHLAQGNSSIIDRCESLQPDEQQQPQWSDLPPECRREVLLRLSDPRDIEASSEACEHLAILAQEQRIWRELAQYHFTPQQIATTRQNNPGKDWKTIFTIARRLGYNMNSSYDRAKNIALTFEEEITVASH